MTSELMVTVTEVAALKLKEILKEEDNENCPLRVFVQGGGCSGFEYGLFIEKNGPNSGDKEFESNGVKIIVDPVSINYLKGTEIDFVEGPAGSGFKFNNPNAVSTCGCGQSFNTGQNSGNSNS